MDERTEKLKEDLHQELLEVKVCIVLRTSTSHLQLISRSTYIWVSVFESIVPNNIKLILSDPGHYPGYHLWPVLLFLVANVRVKGH